MQFSDILPFLEAEIERLQRARDLLASLTLSSTHSVPTHASAALALERELADHSPAPRQDGSQDESQDAESVPVQHLRARRSREGRRTVIRKQPSVQESALRGAVPAGPVAVSPEDLRRAQALKAPSTVAPPLELKPPVWRSPETDDRSVDAMLQKLMKMGSEEELQPVAAAQPG